MLSAVLLPFLLPRRECRGLIEALMIDTSLVTVRLALPRRECRGLIEALRRRLHSALSHQLPRRECRGLIEAGVSGGREIQYLLYFRGVCRGLIEALHRSGGVTWGRRQRRGSIFHYLQCLE